MPYPSGYTPAGFEVGQRTDTFQADYPVRATPSLYARDQRVLTEERIKRLFAAGRLGFSALPTWMPGSSRSFTLSQTADYDGGNALSAYTIAQILNAGSALYTYQNNILDGGASSGLDRESLPYPNPAFFIMFRDLLYGLPAQQLLQAARNSYDPAFSLETGPGLPNSRLAWSYPDILLPGATLPDGRVIRLADSLWDFLTAFDPIALGTETGETVLRNLSPLTLITIPVTAAPNVSLFPGPGQPDEPIAIIWNDTPSLDQSAFIPAVQSVAPVALGFDLAGPFLTPPRLPDIWSAAQIGYPTYYRNVVTGPDSWPNKIPIFGFTPTIGLGQDQIFLPGVPPETVVLQQANRTTGIAQRIALQNGWDTAGETMRLLRRDGENDYSYGGRQQRLWLYALLAGSSWASGSHHRIDRSLAAILGRAAILPNWDGYTPSILPTGTTHLDTLDVPMEVSRVQLFTNQGDVIEGNNTQTLQTRYDLFSYDDLQLYKNDLPLLLGANWLLSEEDPTRFYLQIPLLATDSLLLVGSRRSPARVALTVDPTHANRSQSLGSQWLPALGRLYQERTSFFDGLPRRASTVPFEGTELLAEPLRTPTTQGWTGNLIASYGPTSYGAAESRFRLLLTAGRVIPTLLGDTISPVAQTPTWASKPRSGQSLTTPPFDLEVCP